MVIWWLCWHRTILIRNITQKQYSQFPPVHDFGKPWWGVAYVPCMTNLRALYAWVIRWHVTCMLSLAEHWQGRRALSNHVCAHSVISMWHVVCLQHLARACSEQSRSTTVLPINHVIQMPQCLSGFVNHDYSSLFKFMACNERTLNHSLNNTISHTQICHRASQCVTGYHDRNSLCNQNNRRYKQLSQRQPSGAVTVTVFLYRAISIAFAVLVCKRFFH